MNPSSLDARAARAAAPVPLAHHNAIVRGLLEHIVESRPLSEREVTQHILDALIREAKASATNGPHDFGLAIRIDLQAPLITIVNAFSTHTFRGTAELAAWLVARCAPQPQPEASPSAGAGE